MGDHALDAPALISPKNVLPRVEKTETAPTFSRILNHFSNCTFLTGIYERDLVDGQHPLRPPEVDLKTLGRREANEEKQNSAKNVDEVDAPTVVSRDRFNLFGQIDKDKISIIKDEFQKFDRPLTVVDFVLVLMDHLPGERESIVSQLMELFDHIDIDGRKMLTWHDFTSFLVDQYMADVVSDFRIIKLQRSQCRDESRMSGTIERIYHFRNLDKIAFFEQGSKVLKLVTPDLTPFKELHAHNGSLLCVAYIEELKILAVATSDLLLTFYDVETSFKVIRKFQTKTSTLVMCWSEEAKALFSADHEGTLFCWDIDRVRAGATETNKEFGSSLEKRGDQWQCFIKDEISRAGKMRHIDETVVSDKKKRRDSGKKHHASGAIVHGLLELPGGQLASCGGDNNIMWWDVHTGKTTRILRGHTMGVRAMAFSLSTKELFTGGFDYYIYVWGRYVDNTPRTILSGHSASIVAIEVLDQSSQAVSVDSDGALKIWDLRGNYYVCLQNLMVEDGNNHIRGFVAIPNKKRVIVAGRKLMVFDYQHSGQADQTDEAPILKATYNDCLKLFFTATGTHINVWDAFAGSVKCVITHKKDAEITDFCIDRRGRKAFVGDHTGTVRAYNTTTGCLIKELTPHSGEITGMIYCAKDCTLITSSWDSSFVIHDETSEQPRVWRRARQVHKGDITCIAYSPYFSLIATGSDEKVICVQDYGRLRLVSSLLGHQSDISALRFLAPYPLLCSADLDGNIAVWGLPPHQHAEKLLARFTNMQSLESATSVTCMDYRCSEDTKLRVYTGDDEGHVRVWDLDLLLSTCKVVPAPEMPCTEPYRKVELDCEHFSTIVHRKKESGCVDNFEKMVGLVTQPVVKAAFSWMAHQDSLRSIQVCESPGCLITAGYDRMTKIWHFDGTLMSVLRIHGNSEWNFPCQGLRNDVEDDQLQKVLDAVNKLEAKQIASRPTIPQSNESIVA